MAQAADHAVTNNGTAYGLTHGKANFGSTVSSATRVGWQKVNNNVATTNACATFDGESQQPSISQPRLGR